MTQHEHRLRVIRLFQNGRPLYLGYLRAKDLFEMSKVDIWDPDLSLISLDDIERQGYQRAPMKTHFTKVARYLLNEKEALLPTSILLSARGELRFEAFDDKGDLGDLIIPNEVLPLYIVDGQHRVEGLRYAVEYSGKDELKDFVLPATILERVPKLEEVRQFYVVNTTAKRIRTDLAARLLRAMADKDPDLELRLIGEGRKWKLRATKIANLMNSESGWPWQGRIRRPNAPRLGEAVVSETSFSQSLKPLLSGSFLEQLEDELVVALLTRYWGAIAELIPTAFENPRDYVIQKTTGVYALHMVAPRVFELCRSADDFSRKAIRDLLTHSEEARDYFTREDIWRTKTGDLSIYNSMKGFRQLADQIIETLPRVEVRISV